MKKVIFVKRITYKEEMGKTEYINIMYINLDCDEHFYEDNVPPFMC